MSNPLVPEAYRETARELKEQGWTCEQAGSGHIRWVSPTGETVTSASSPSDRRARLEFVADLRRAGAVIQGRGSTSRDSGQQEEVAERRPEPEPVTPPPEAADLRELVTEARQLLGDLRTERRAIEKLLKDDAAGLVVQEINAWFGKSDIAELVRVTLASIHDAGQKQVDEFAQESGKMLRYVDRTRPDPHTPLACGPRGGLPSPGCRPTGRRHRGDRRGAGAGGGVRA